MPSNVSAPPRSQEATRRVRHRPLLTHTRRVLIAVSLTVLLAAGFAFIPQRAQAQSLVGPKQYYLALGDSLAFGFQPDLNWDDSYPTQWYANLHQHGSQSRTNYACNGETSSTFINGGCPYWYALHDYYLGSQLSAALSFIRAHRGQVSPVSLDMGANDLLPDINSSTCAVSSSWSTDLANLDNRLVNTILPQLVAALKVNGVRTGDLVMMNYYDPYQNKCPNSVSYVETLNSHIAADAAQFGVPVANVFAAFGGAAEPDPDTCTYTWFCSAFHDVHATTTGYGVIAGAFESVTGY